MIRDFVHFLRHFRETFRYVRAVLLVLLLLLSICAIVFVLSEGLPLGEAIYLTLITAFTVGYGDIVPVTTVGRITSIFAGFLGMVIMGLNVAIAAHALSQSYKDKRHEKDQPPST